mmetsp:Transcript_8499/g.11465  ORF Transcript_8499/g.11465 Transcript_8499/m.11465 type:complete len:179 (-) Transcript_8499:32-568(-)
MTSLFLFCLFGITLCDPVFFTNSSLRSLTWQVVSRQYGDCTREGPAVAQATTTSEEIAEVKVTQSNGDVCGTHQIYWIFSSESQVTFFFDPPVWVYTQTCGKDCGWDNIPQICPALSGLNCVAGSAYVALQQADICPNGGKNCGPSCCSTGTFCILDGNAVPTGTCCSEKIVCGESCY